MSELPEKLYFRDDQAVVADRPVSTSRGVTFGWSTPDTDDDLDATQTTFRVFWNDTGAWEFAPVYSPAGALGLVPGLPEAVAALRPQAGVGEFCAAIESVGFSNAATLTMDGLLPGEELRRRYERYQDLCAVSGRPLTKTYEQWLGERVSAEEALKNATSVVDDFAALGTRAPD